MKKVTSLFDIALSKLNQTPFAPLLEADVYNLIHKEVSIANVTLSEKELAELMAFRFIEVRNEEKQKAGAFFQPLIVTPNEDGSFTEFPSVSKINKSMIDYWEYRAKNCQHPVLIARYSGLVYDYSYTATGKNAHHKMGELFIDALLETVVQKLYKVPVYAIGKVKRALEVAILMNKDMLIEKAKNVIIALETEIAIDDKPGLWGFSYDYLINGKKKWVTAIEENEIILNLENRLLNVAEKDAWATECAAQRLGNYYRINGQPEQVKRVLKSLELSYQKITENSSQIQKAHHIEKLFHYYVQFGLKEEADKALIQLREAGKQADAEMKSIFTELDIPKEKIDAYVDQLLKGKDDILFARIIAAHMPNVELAKQEIGQQFKEAPLKFFLSKNLLDEKGRTVARIPPLNEDPDSHMVLHISNSIRIGTIFLHFTFEEGIKREIFSTHEIMKFLRKSCIIEHDRLAIVEKGLEAYFNHDYITCIHLLVPQFEEAIRNLVEMNGGNVLLAKGDSFQLKTFEHLLNDSLTTDVFGSDATMYFKVLFTDKRGWNLRNTLAHGMLGLSHFNKQNADRFLHAFLSLGMVRLKNAA